MTTPAEQASERADDTAFVECESCSKKPGSPILCDGCLRNRIRMSRLRERLAECELRYAALKQAIWDVPGEPTSARLRSGGG